MMTTVTPAHLLTGHIPTCITVKSFNPVTALARCLLEVDQLALQPPAATQHEGALLLAAPAIIYGQ